MEHDPDCFLSSGDDGRFPCICGKLHADRMRGPEAYHDDAVERPPLRSHRGVFAEPARRGVTLDLSPEDCAYFARVIDDTDAKLARYQEALEYYANGIGWSEQEDNGETARTALSHTKGDE